VRAPRFGSAHPDYALVNPVAATVWTDRSNIEFYIEPRGNPNGLAGSAMRLGEVERAQLATLVEGAQVDASARCPHT